MSYISIEFLIGQLNTLTDSTYKEEKPNDCNYAKKVERRMPAFEVLY